MIKQIEMMMKIVVALTLFLNFFICDNCLFAQETPYNLIKFGIMGYGAITDTSHINSMANDWIYKVVEESNAEVSSEPKLLPFNIEYGFQPFILIRPIKFLQIGVKMDFAYSKLVSKFQNPLFRQNYELNINMKSYIPGVFSYLTLGKFELGGGVIRSFTNVKINDGFFGYKDTWYGKNTGYELSLGRSTSLERHVGFTISVKYRSLFINEIKDTLNRIVVYSGTRENLSLDMSGFMIDMGLYFQFIKIK